jgi:hypothetical protein
MGLSNAERQARWRARRQAELDALRQQRSSPDAETAAAEDPLRNLDDAENEADLAEMLIERFGEDRMLDIAPRFFMQAYNEETGTISKNPIPKLIAAAGKFASVHDVDEIPLRDRKALVRACMRALSLGIDMLQPKETMFERWERLVGELRELQDAMQESLDNMPDNFRGTERTERLEACAAVDLSELESVT